MKFLLVCAGGMSSAIAAKSLEETAKKKGIDLEVQEIGTQAFEDEVGEGYQLALVAPQIRHRFDTLKSQADAVSVPIILIKPQGYSPIGGEFLLNQIKQETNVLE
ncbi:PTS sugar transporter subunit IIB [Facklamia miroungae]|uniref:PTS system, cellobiose-specific IIB component n=1 Tax=Facklamia miroungae TaxID=120956 RepID=A0A1G7RYD2_9LACT|nr:PTS sugar transporter subunit IIB [Facklamia miroungae]NKZ29246.1 PTS sugar transporter subunit IIB [Facklamia miroungae]SDG15239.1 PTS system, cellobiose-specific IIB component [Facklamia miroungae]